MRTERPGERYGRIALLLAPLGIALWAIVTCAASPSVHEAHTGHDVFLPLDAAWRMLRGQVQHRDFYSPYGPVEPSLVAWMMRLGGVNALAIPRAQALVGVVAAGAAAVAARRMERIAAAWLVLVVALTAVGRTTISFPFYFSSHAAYYNRIGLALLAPVLVECLVPPGPSGASSSQTFARGALSGFLTAILVFVKPTYPLVAVLFLVMSAVTLPPSRQRGVGLAAGAVAGLVAGGALIGFHYGAMLGDYAFVARARRLFGPGRPSFFDDMYVRELSTLKLGRVVETVVQEGWPTLLVAALVFVMPVDAVRPPERRQIGALAALVWLAAIGLSLTGWQWGGSPLFAVLALVLVEHARRSRAAGEAADLRRLVCAGLAAACVGSFALKQTASVAYDWQWQRGDTKAADTFPWSPPARGLVLEESGGFCNPEGYGARVTEAAALLREIPDPRVLVLDFSNPFPYLLASTPPRGGGVCWHHGSTFSDDVHLAPATMFGDANVVVVPKCAEDFDAVWSLSNLYAATLERDFHPWKETNAFSILRRND